MARGYELFVLNSFFLIVGLALYIAGVVLMYDLERRQNYYQDLGVTYNETEYATGESLAIAGLVCFFFAWVLYAPNVINRPVARFILFFLTGGVIVGVLSRVLDFNASERRKYDIATACIIAFTFAISFPETYMALFLDDQQAIKLERYFNTIAPIAS
jgi:uncharacterized membrane protein